MSREEKLTKEQIKYRVIVKKDNLFYECQAKTEYEYKCGKCLFGIILAAREPTYYLNVCKRCGAKHFSTTWGTNEMNMQIFNSNY